LTLILTNETIKMQILKKEDLNSFKYPKDETLQEVSECLNLIKKDTSINSATKEYKIKYLINIMINSLSK